MSICCILLGFKKIMQVKLAAFGEWAPQSVLCRYNSKKKCSTIILTCYMIWKFIEFDRVVLVCNNIKELTPIFVCSSRELSWQQDLEHYAFKWLLLSKKWKTAGWQVGRIPQPNQEWCITYTTWQEIKKIKPAHILQKPQDIKPLPTPKESHL